MIILKILSIALVVVVAISLIVLVWFFYELTKYRQSKDFDSADWSDKQLDQLVKRFANKQKYG